MAQKHKYSNGFNIVFMCLNGKRILYIPFCVFDLACRALPRTQCNNFIAQLNPIGIASENFNAF